jgi:hypothetical protein
MATFNSRNVKIGITVYNIFLLLFLHVYPFAYSRCASRGAYTHFGVAWGNQGITKTCSTFVLIAIETHT